MLEVRNLKVNYGAIAAVRGIDLDIATGEIVALIGANGAGKTTVARAIAGLLPYQGDIVFGGEKLKPNNAERNLRLGSRAGAGRPRHSCQHERGGKPADGPLHPHRQGAKPDGPRRTWRSGFRSSPSAGMSWQAC